MSGCSVGITGCARAGPNVRTEFHSACRQQGDASNDPVLRRVAVPSDGRTGPIFVDERHRECRGLDIRPLRNSCAQRFKKSRNLRSSGGGVVRAAKERHAAPSHHASHFKGGELDAPDVIGERCFFPFRDEVQPVEKSVRQIFAEERTVCPHVSVYAAFFAVNDTAFHARDIFFRNAALHAATAGREDSPSLWLTRALARTVGQTLFVARQRRGLTLDDLSRATNIPVALLQAIERDDVARLPQEFFRRSFVRTYAREVGLDPDDLLPSLQPIGAGAMPPHAETSRRLQEPSSSRSLVLAMTLAGACAMFYSGFATQVLMRPSAGSEIPQTVRAQPIAMAVSPCASIVPLPLTIQPERRAATVVRASAVATETAAVTEVPPDNHPDTIDAIVDTPPAFSDVIAPLPDAVAAPATVQ